MKYKITIPEIEIIVEEVEDDGDDNGFTKYAVCNSQAKAYKHPDRELGAFDVGFTIGDKVPYDYVEAGPPGDGADYALGIVSSFPKFTKKNITKVWIRLDDRWEF